MSVLIKGIELPEKVQVLELHSDGKVFTRKGYLVGEAVALPDKYGRLVDADEMLRRLQAWNTSDGMDKALYNFTWHRIMEQPTVVEAEDTEC